nr:MAG TPA: hypothetical protein [Caudoviricetes sp.]
MSRIDELLSRPLPSKSKNYFFEADEMDKYSNANDAFVKADGVEPNQQYQEDDDYGYNDDDAEDAFSGRYSSYGDDDDDDAEDVGTDDLSDIGSLDDLDSLDDEELADLDRELSGDLDDMYASDDEEEELSTDAEMDADDKMSLAATALLVNDELNEDEKRDFVENESAIAMREGFLTDADVNMITESYMSDDDYFSEAKYNKPMMIRLDAESKKKQLYALAINVCAAANNDGDYRKLKKLMRLRKILRAKLDKKYHGQAIKRMKVYFNRLRKSKSPVLSNIAKKVDK